jgi:calcium-dependent protein kinase
MKIADFGFAKVVMSSSQLNKTLVGTPLYMSPQLLKSERYTSKCDIWAIGILTYELLYGKLPWTGNSQL